MRPIRACLGGVELHTSLMIAKKINRIFVSS